MDVVLVYNKKSGSSARLSELKKSFDEASFTITETIEVEDGFEKKLKRHIRAGKIIAAVGGDGTISAVANLLADTKAPFMPLPGGTLNHFTKDLGIPQSLPEALEYFKTAKPKAVDVGMVEDRVFINNSSIGIYSQSLLIREEHEKRYGKWPAILIAGLATLFKFRTYDVLVNGKHYATALIFIGNNKYAFKDLRFQRTKLNEGVLSVYIATATSRFTFLKALLGMTVGGHSSVKNLHYFSTSELTISGRRSLRVSRDGEHERMGSPLQYSVQKASLAVLQHTQEKR